jgi:hypothetical protein
MERTLPDFFFFSFSQTGAKWPILPQARVATVMTSAYFRFATMLGSRRRCVRFVSKDTFFC